MSSEFQVNGRVDASDVAAALLLAERRTALLSRCRPLNMKAERERLLRDWRGGGGAEPEFRYAAREDMSVVRAQLSALKRRLHANPWGDLYAARIDELILETRLAEAADTAQMAELSQQRYWLPFEQAAAAALATDWRKLECPVVDELVVSDDVGDPRSLVRRVQAWVGRERLPFRVEVSGELVSLAATGEGFIVVAAQRKTSVQDAERVAVHEVLGHARPRVRARFQEVAVFASGSAGGNDTQEGYAVYCEHEAGVLHDARRFELAIRHLACLGVWRGVRFSENVENLMVEGASLELALDVCLRAYRGGGLAREGAYLPAYCAVSRAIAEDGAVADWLAAGRVSLPTITHLRDSGQRLDQCRGQPPRAW